MAKKGIAEVVVALPVAGPFHYRIPSRLMDDLKVGARVWVPFRDRLKVGYVVGLLTRSNVQRPKDIKKLIDPEPILSPEILELTRWVADYYHCSWGEAIEAAIPGPLKQGKTRVRLRKSRLGTKQPKSSLEGFHNSNAFSACSERSLKPSIPSIGPLEDVLNSIIESSVAERPEIFLLSGVPFQERVGLYLEATAHTLSRGRSVIVLVPEIVAAPRMAASFRARFGEDVAIFHSRLSPSERFYQWHRIREGATRVVIGARSAVFAPAKDLGLIIVDEEHQISYKEDQAPRYNARDVAIERARQAGAATILGAEVPSLESYYNAKEKRYKSIDLAEKMEPCLPEVHVVNMRDEPKGGKSKKVFSRVLEGAIRRHLSMGGKVVLFLNRRGFATFISCRGCGFVIRCRSCRASLIYHFYKKKLICRYCNYQQEPPEVCPECKKRYLSYLGLGTQKVESEAARLFPEAAISRIDLDATRSKASHQEVLKDLREGRVHILVGTQMVTSAMEIPGVSLVGLISADLMVNLPDFRSSERMVQLVGQLSGIVERAGSGGELIIQTYNPSHYSISSITAHDFNGFFEEELKMRKELGYPPYLHLVNVTLRGKREEKVVECAKALAKRLKRSKPRGVTTLGPAPLAIPKLRGYFRWHLLIKAKEVGPINNFLRKAFEGFKVPRAIILTINVDPLMML